MKTGIYRHYQGEYYLVLFVGQHTETGETLVTYIPLTDNEGRKGSSRIPLSWGAIRYRPLNGPEGFTTPVHYPKNVLHDEMDGPRFEYVGDEMSHHSDEEEHGN